MVVTMVTYVEEDLSDGMNIEICDYTITSCVKDRQQDCERPLTSSVSVESRSISLKQRIMN